MRVRRTPICTTPRTPPASDRIILFTDVERPLHTRAMTAVNQRLGQPQHH